MKINNKKDFKITKYIIFVLQIQITKVLKKCLEKEQKLAVKV